MREWFPHDIYARSDHKIRLLQDKCGVRAYGLYWIIVEEMYSNCGVLTEQMQTLCIRDAKYRQSADDFCIMVDIGLFYKCDDGYTSERVQVEIQDKLTRSKSAKKSADIRWKRNANAMRWQCK